MTAQKITVIDEHHEAFLFWSEFLCEKEKPGILLHVDGHADMGIPYLTDSAYTRDVADFVSSQLEIGNFILPAVLRGYFNEVIFVGRDVRDIERRKDRMGSLDGRGIWIKNGLKRDRLTRRLFPDAKDWHFMQLKDVSKTPQKPVVLDIDMDYFCGYFRNYSDVSLPLTEEQIRLLNDLERSDDRFGIRLRLFDREGDRLKVHGEHRFKNIVYNDSEPWIETAIRFFVESLVSVPTHICLCRSVKSGYTPASRTAFIEKTLIAYLTGKQGRPIDPMDIPGPLEIQPHAVALGNVLYSPLTDDVIQLNEDMRFIWKRITAGKSFADIVNAMRKRYDVPPETLVSQLVDFILNLKQKFVLK